MLIGRSPANKTVHCVSTAREERITPLMPKPHELTDHEYERYRKTHGYHHPTDEEEAKIRRELAQRAKLHDKSRSARSQNLTGPIPLDHLDDLAAELADPERTVRQRKLLGNARAHKKRLRSLKNREREEG